MIPKGATVVGLVPVGVFPAVTGAAGVLPEALAGLMVSLPAVDGAGATALATPPFWRAMYQMAPRAARPIRPGTA